jgi:hypothetical protein
MYITIIMIIDLKIINIIRFKYVFYLLLSSKMNYQILEIIKKFQCKLTSFVVNHLQKILLNFP